jgi:hypothetical protein
MGRPDLHNAEGLFVDGVLNCANCGAGVSPACEQARRLHHKSGAFVESLGSSKRFAAAPGTNPAFSDFDAGR